MAKKIIYIIGDTDLYTGRSELTDKIIGKANRTSNTYFFDHTNSLKSTEKIVYYELSYDFLTLSTGKFRMYLDHNRTLMIIFCLKFHGRNEGNTMQMALSTVLKEATVRGIFLVLVINNCFVLQDSGIIQIEPNISDTIKSVHVSFPGQLVHKININSNRYNNSSLGIDRLSNIIEFLTFCYSRISFRHKRDIFQIMMKSEEDISGIKEIIKKEQEDHEKIMKHLERGLRISIPNDVIFSIFDYIRSDY